MLKINKLFNFLKRDFYIMISYKVNLILGIFSMFIGILKFGFMAHFLSLGNTFPLISNYGEDLISYLITGGIFMSYVNMAMNSFQSTIRSEQRAGTLEFLLLSNTPVHEILIFTGISSFLWTTVDATAIFIIVIGIFGFKTNINLALTLFVLLLSVLCMSGIGLMSAGIIMVTKKGDPIGWIFTSLTGLLSGVFYPISTLPHFLQVFSYVLPPTFALKALRASILSGATFYSVSHEIIVLLAMTSITVPLGLLTFKWGFNEARRRGSLIEY